MCYVSSISNLCKYVTETVESISLGTSSNHMITIWWLDQDNSSGQHTNKPRPLGFQFSHHRASSSMTLSKRANCLASSTGVGRGVGQRSIDGPWPQPLWAVNQQKWMNWSQSWREHLKETPARFDIVKTVLLHCLIFFPPIYPLHWNALKDTAVDSCRACKMSFFQSASL